MSHEMHAEVTPAVEAVAPSTSITDVLTAIAKVNKIITKLTDPATLKLFADFVAQLLSEAQVKANAAK